MKSLTCYSIKIGERSVPGQIRAEYEIMQGLTDARHQIQMFFESKSLMVSNKMVIPNINVNEVLL